MKTTTHPDLGLLTAGAALVCTLGFVSALVPVVEDVLAVTLATLAVAAVLVLIARRIVRVLRWRREDRDDERTAAAWRAAHSAGALVPGVGVGGQG